MDYPRQFKRDAIERLLEQHKDQLSPVAYNSLQRIIEQGADKLDLSALNRLCRQLECLPTDILRAV